MGRILWEGDDEMNWYDVSVEPPREDLYFGMTPDGIFTTLAYSPKHKKFNCRDWMDKERCEKYSIPVSAWAFLPDPRQVEAEKKMSR